MSISGKRNSSIAHSDRWQQRLEAVSILPIARFLSVLGYGHDTHVSPVVAPADAVFANLEFIAVDSSSAIALSSVFTTIQRPLGIAIGIMVVASVVGTVLAAGFSTTVRSISDDVADRPDLAFATGFLGFFGLLVVAASPLVAAMVLDHAAVTAVAGITSLPGLLLWALLLLVGSCIGAIVVGDRLARRITGDSPSLTWAVVIGAVLLGGCQLVPVLGALVAMGLATVATGAVLRRRFDIDGRLFDTDELDREATTDPSIQGPAADWGADRTGETVWHSSEDHSSTPASEPVSERTETSVDEPRGDDWTLAIDEHEQDEDDPADDELTADHWDWGAETDPDAESRAESVDDG